MEVAGDISPSEKEALAKEFRDLEEIRNREAKSRAVVLEILGDIPDADVTPPKNVLFVCKLNPVTEEGDLKIIFSRFGNVKKCDIIKDYVTGDSLQYAFIEFETEESCNEAYFKMQNVLIDDRRSDHNRHNRSTDSKRSRKGDRKRALDETRPHRKHESEERKRSSGRKTRSSRERRVKRRGSADSDPRRRSSSSSDSYGRVARSSSRDTFGRRKDHRLNYTKRSISRGSISRSMSKHKVRSTSTSIEAMISSRRENRMIGRRIGPRQRRPLRSGSRSQESRRRRPRNRSPSVGRTKKARRTYSSSRSPESPGAHVSEGSGDEPERKYRRRSTSSISSSSLNAARRRRSRG